jgi:lipoate-protein ligase A
MWRLLRTPPARGAFNMALDAALMDYARETDAWVLRVYSWSAPTLSLGRNQRARGGYDLARLAEQGIDVVRRPTGGRAILHDREITYAVAAPIADAGDLGESYARINRLLLAGLRALGAGAVEVAGDAARIGGADGFAHREEPGLLPCFHHPSIGEITLDGRKLVGSAQWRCDGALLQHGSILVDDDQVQLSSLLIEGGAPIPRAATLRDVLGCAPTDIEMADALFGAVRAYEDETAREIALDAALSERANALRAHYLDDGWTWRR